MNVYCCLCVRSVVGRPVRQVSLKRSASTTSSVARSPSVARHASLIRRAASFRPEDISTPTFQSSTNSLLATAPTASRMAAERLTPLPVRSTLHDDRIQPTRLAPLPPITQTSVFSSLSEGRRKPAFSASSSAVEGLRTNTDQPDVSSVSSSESSSFRSAVEDPVLDDRSDSSATVRAPPRPRHAYNKVVRAESLRQQLPSNHSACGQTEQSAVASVVASLRDRFEARRAASSHVPGASETVSPDTANPSTTAKPNIPPKPGAATAGDDEVGRRINKRLHRQPAFREFDVMGSGSTSTGQFT